MTRLERAAREEEPEEPAEGALRNLRVRGETRSVHVDDVDEVIGLAAELKEQAADRLTTADLEEIGRELDIEPTYVRKAVDAQEARRKEQERQTAKQAQAAARAQAKRRRLATQVGIAAASLALVLFAAVYAKQSSLSEARAVVDQKAAQVDNVVERQAAVKARYENAPPGDERDAMLDGAENRVRIERRRYDEAAAAYNAEAGGALARFAAGLFGLPAQVPLSNEVERW